MTKRITIAYICTTFPVLTETFIQREIRVLNQLDLDIKIYSLWGGSKQFDTLIVHRFCKWKLLTLLWRLPILLIKNSNQAIDLTRYLNIDKFPSLLNAAENLLGACFAIVYRDHFLKEKPDLLHGIWATTPAIACMCLSQLTKIPYSMEAHAYDVYENGGDGFLEKKLENAKFVRTSTQTVQKKLQSLSKKPGKILFVRRGFDSIPQMEPIRVPRTPIRILSVGRLIEKKGYLEQIQIYSDLRKASIPFTARIIGNGALKSKLLDILKKKKLLSSVKFLGSMPYDSVIDEYTWADLFIFTGIQSKNGDQDGFPNVISEAMAYGIPVLAFPSDSLKECLTNNQHCVLIAKGEKEKWIKTVHKLMTQDRYYEKLRNQAREWVLHEYDANVNLMDMFHRIQEVVR